MPGSILSPAAVSQVRSWRERRLISWSRSAATLRMTMDSFPMSVSYLMFLKAEGQTDGIPSAVVSTHAWHLLFQLSWGASVRAPTPRCTRTGNSPTTNTCSTTNPCASNATTLCENNIQLSTTAGCINNYTNQKTKLLSTSKKDADRSRLMLISKFCYVSTFKSGF